MPAKYVVHSTCVDGVPTFRVVGADGSGWVAASHEEAVMLKDEMNAFEAIRRTQGPDSSRTFADT